MRSLLVDFNKQYAHSQNIPKITSLKLDIFIHCHFYDLCVQKCVTTQCHLLSSNVKSSCLISSDTSLSPRTYGEASAKLLNLGLLRIRYWARKFMGLNSGSNRLVAERPFSSTSFSSLSTPRIRVGKIWWCHSNIE